MTTTAPTLTSAQASAPPLLRTADFPGDDGARRSAAFSGETFLREPSRASRALGAHALAFVERAFWPLDPQRAQLVMTVDRFVAAIAPMKSAFTNDSTTARLVRELVVESGCDPDATFFDVPRLRVVTSGGYLQSGVGYAYRAHRDTWYASPHAQLNWWMALFGVTPGRGMDFYPAEFARPFPNSSADFDYAEWCRVGRVAATSQGAVDTRRHPLPGAPLPAAEARRIRVDPAQILLFSAAHLHGTTPNATGVTRFSIDFRTVHAGDLELGRGAPNVDGRARGSTLGDFRRVSDLSPVPAALVREEALA